MRFLGSVFSIVVAILLLTGGTAFAEDGEDRDFRRANNAFEANLYEFSHRHFLIFSQKYPNSERLNLVYLKLGICSYNLAQSEEGGEQKKLLLRAEEELQVVIKRFPLSTVEIDCKYWLGEVNLGLGRFDEAIALFDLVLKSNAQSEYNQDACLSLAYAHFQKGDYNKSIAILDTFEKEFPKPQKKFQYCFQRGMCLFFLGKYEEASDFFNILVNQTEDTDFSAKSLFWLAECYYKLNKFEDAIRLYYKVKKETSNRDELVKILYGLGYAYFKNKDYSDSISTFQEIVRISSEPYYVNGSLFKIGENLYRINEFEKAIEYFKKVCDVAEYSMPCNFFIGECLYRLNEFEKALNWLNKIPVNDSTLTGILAKRDIGLCYLKTRQYDKALEAFKNMFETSADPKYQGSALSYMADTYLALGEISKALELYRKTLLEHSGYINVPRTRYHVGLCMYKLGQFEEAGEIFAHTYTRYTSGYYSAKAIYQHGEILRRKEDYKRAIEIYSLVDGTEGAPTELIAQSKLNVAICFYNSGKVFTALKLFTQLSEDCEIEKIKIEATFQAARCLTQMNRKEKAIALLERIISEHPTSSFAPSALFEIASRYYSSGNTVKAATLYQKLLHQYPDSEQADDSLYQLALMALATHNTERCNEFIDRLLESYEQSDLIPSAEILKVGVLVLEGKIVQAMKEYETLGKKYKMHAILPLVRLEHANLLYTQDKYEEALALYLEVTKSEVSEWASKAEMGSGKCYKQLGNSEKALEYFVSLIMTSSDIELKDSAILLASDIYVDMSKYDEAEKLLTLHSDKSRAANRIKELEERRKTE